MATLADPWRSIAYSIRSLPAQFGLRPYSVSVVIGTWYNNTESTHVGDGSKNEQLIPILENGGTNPKLRFANEEQRALSGMEVGSCTIGPITPYFGSGGTPISNLLPAVANGETVHVIITGPQFPNGAKFSVKKVETDRALHWTMLCEPVNVEA